MSQVEALRRITEAAAAHAFATAQLANTRQRLDEALRLSGEVGTALRPFLLEREEPQRGLPPDPAPAWIAPEILRADDQEERFAAFVRDMDPDPIAEAFELQEVDEPGTANAREIPDGSPRDPLAAPLSIEATAALACVDLDRPMTLNALANLIGVKAQQAYDAAKLGNIPSDALVTLDPTLPPRVYPRKALRAWRPTRALPRIRELLGEVPA